MNLYQCQKYAENHGHDSIEFVAHFPIGPVKCKWLDAYFGMFTSEHPAFNDGFIMVRDVDAAFPDLKVDLVQAEQGASS